MHPTAPTASRMTWMDTFRGAAMLLVVVFHSVAMYKSLSGTDHVPAVDPVVAFFDPYRMPLLLFLSGLLLQRALAKPFGAYLAGKARNILWPLLLWSLAEFTITHQLASALDPWAWVDGTYQWFLVVLVACFLVAPLTRWVPPLIMAVLFALAYLTVGQQVPEVARIFFYGPFFFLGAGLQRWTGPLQRLPVWVGLTGVVVAATVGALSATGELTVHQNIPWTLLAPVPGLLVLLWLGPRLPRTPGLEAVGRDSIIYYVSHTAVLLVVADLWRAAGWDVHWPTLIVLFLAAFGVPTFIAAHRSRFIGLFVFPGVRPSRAADRVDAGRSELITATRSLPPEGGRAAG
ncbi:acyltransferase [Cellulosimicrobium funkei]|nr:acyltransferase [Cellulosimicrobium funkei]